MAQNIERVDKNYEIKMAGFEIDCNDGKGEAAACHHAGEFYATVKQEHKRAAEIYEVNCNTKNYGPSCLNLGRFHLIGKGVEQNDAKALDYLDRGCKDNLPAACYFQGMLLYDGLKPPGSKFGRATPKMTQVSKAELDRIAANPAAAVPATPVQQVEKKVERTKAEIAEETTRRALAFEKLAIACDGGETMSCHFLGSQNLRTDNPARNPAKAIEYLTRSCNSNHAPSCFQLGVLFNKGDTGVPKNPELFEKYRAKTEELVAQAGGNLSGIRTG